MDSNGNSESTNRDESEEATKKNANTSGAVGGGVVKQASLDSMRYSLHRKLRKAAEHKKILSAGMSSPFTLSASSQRSGVGTEEATLAHHQEDTSSGKTTTASTVESSECCNVDASSSSAASASAHSTVNDDDTKPVAHYQPQSAAVERQKRSSTTFFENVVPSSLTRRTSSSTVTSIINSSLTSAPVVTEFVPEVAHRIRDLVLVRVKDQKRVVVESFWNNLVSEDPTTAEEDNENPLSSPPLPVLYRAPSVGDAPDHNAPIVRSQHGQPALICLFRRWGCCICRMTAASLSSLKPFLDERGIRLIGVGFESIGMKKFIEAGHFGGELYLDPSKTLYKRVECRNTNWKSLWGLASLEVWGLYAKAAKRQYQVDFQGDYSQLGAVVLIDAHGVTRFLQIQTGDRFQIDTVKILETIGITPPDDYDPLPDAHKKVW